MSVSHKIYQHKKHHDDYDRNSDHDRSRETATTYFDSYQPLKRSRSRQHSSHSRSIGRHHSYSRSHSRSCSSYRSRSRSRERGRATSKKHKHSRYSTSRSSSRYRRSRSPKNYRNRHRRSRSHSDYKHHDGRYKLNENADENYKAYSSEDTTDTNKSTKSKYEHHHHHHHYGNVSDEDVERKLKSQISEDRSNDATNSSSTNYSEGGDSDVGSRNTIDFDAAADNYHKHKCNNQHQRQRHYSRDNKDNNDKNKNKYLKKVKENDGNNDEIDDLSNLPLPPKNNAVGAYYNLNFDEPIDKERIHREMEEKLRQTLAKEGKIYPPPKAEASHPVFANDGSFLEIFKKMQEAHKMQLQQKPTPVIQQQILANVSVVTTAVAGTAAGTPAIGTATAARGVATAVAGIGMDGIGGMAVTPIGGGPTIITTSTTRGSIGGVVPMTAMQTTTTRVAPPTLPVVGRRRGGKILKTGVVAKKKNQMDNGADPKDFWSLYLAEVNKYKNHACESEGGTRPLVK